MGDREKVRVWVQGRASSSGASNELELERTFDIHSVPYDVAADSAAGDTVSETIFYQVPAAAYSGGAHIRSIAVCPSSTVAYNATNYATVTIKQRDGAGGSAATVAALDTSAANWTANVPKAMVVTEANTTIPAGGVLTFTKTKAASGVQLPACNINIVLEAL